MGRPTDEVKNHIVKCRIGDSLFSKIDGNVSETIRQALECFVTQKKSIVPQKEVNVPQKEVNVPQKGNQLNLSDEDYEIVRETIDMIQKSRDEDGELIDASAFLKDFHDKLESGEYDLSSGKLKLGYHEVFEVLNTSEVKGWLRPVWNACKDKERPYTDGLKAVFKHGAPLAEQDVYGERQ